MTSREEAESSLAQGNNALQVLEVVHVISTFVPSEEFGFFAVASKMCREVWGNRPNITHAITVHSTPAHLRCCFDMGLKRSRKVCRKAAKFGLLSVLKYASSQGCTIDARTANTAACNGHCDVLTWLIGQGCPVDESTCYNASRNGHLRCLKYLRSVRCVWDALTCSAAARWGHFEVLKWALGEKCPCNVLVLCAAAENGNMSILRHVYAHLRVSSNDRPDPRVCEAAAAGGHIHVLEWAIRKGYKWNADTARVAALKGRLEVFMWGHSKGCYLSKGPSVMRWAAASGSTDLLSWMSTNGFEHDSGLCKLALRRGHLHVLLWAHAFDPGTIDESVWRTAVENKDLRSIEWLKQIGCPGST